MRGRVLAALAPALIVAAGLAGAAGYGLARYQAAHPAPTERVFVVPGGPGGFGADVIWRVETPDKLYAITFDDGPDPVWTPRVLEILSRHGATATFFMLGEAAERQPELVERVRSDGHEVASHGWDHSKLTLMDEPVIRRAIDKADQVLGEPRLFRPTYGRIDSPGLREAADHHYRVVLWSHALHGQGQGAAEAVEIAAQASGGMIILAHDGRGSPDEDLMRALDQLLSALDAAGYQGVTVSQLLDSARTRTGTETRSGTRSGTGT